MGETSFNWGKVGKDWNSIIFLCFMLMLKIWTYEALGGGYNTKLDKNVIETISCKCTVEDVKTLHSLSSIVLSLILLSRMSFPHIETSDYLNQWGPN